MYCTSGWTAHENCTTGVGSFGTTLGSVDGERVLPADGCRSVVEHACLSKSDGNKRLKPNAATDAYVPEGAARDSPINGLRNENRKVRPSTERESNDSVR